MKRLFITLDDSDGVLIFTRLIETLKKTYNGGTFVLAHINAESDCFIEDKIVLLGNQSK